MIQPHTTATLANALTAALALRGLPPVTPARRRETDAGPQPFRPVTASEDRPVALEGATGAAWLYRRATTDVLPGDPRPGLPPLLLLRVPLRLVVVAQARTLSCREGDVAEWVAAHVLAAVTGAGLPLAELGVRSGKLIVERIDDDAARILAAELPRTLTTWPAGHVPVALDLRLELAFDKNCLPSPCP